MGELIRLDDYRSKKEPKKMLQVQSDFDDKRKKVVDSIKRIDNLLQDLKTVTAKEKP